MFAGRTRVTGGPLPGMNAGRFSGVDAFRRDEQTICARQLFKSIVCVRFTLPSMETGAMISSVLVPPHMTEGEAQTSAVDGSDTAVACISGTALVLEDNMIIALDASEILAELGAVEVYTASGVSDAMQALDAHAIAFAMLDVNLGDDSSMEVARRCVENGIRTILATGYDGPIDAIAGFPDLPVVRKPYTIEQVRTALERASEQPDP